MITKNIEPQRQALLTDIDKTIFEAKQLKHKVLNWGSKSPIYSPEQQNYFSSEEFAQLCTNHANELQESANMLYEEVKTVEQGKEIKSKHGTRQVA